jgi:hypothetical protein
MECTINLADDENLMQRMKDVGFPYVFIGNEAAVYLAAIFIHFHKQSGFIVKHITHEIDGEMSREKKRFKIVPTDKVLDNVFAKEFPELEEVERKST